MSTLTASLIFGGSLFVVCAYLLYRGFNDIQAASEEVSDTVVADTDDEVIDASDDVSTDVQAQAAIRSHIR